MPKGYYYKLSGEKESEGDALGGNFLAVIILSTFLFIGVLLLQFKTFKGIIIVLSIIPLGILGGVVFLLINGSPMSLGGDYWFYWSLWNSGEKFTSFGRFYQSITTRRTFD